MTQDLQAPKSDVIDKRPRVRLSELPRGRGEAIWWVCFLMAMLGLFCLIGGGLKATGVLEKPMTENVWLAQQQDVLDQTYDEYIDHFQREDAVTGTLLMAVGTPLLGLLVVFLYFGSVMELTKCQKGHVTYKVYSFCPECGEKVYKKEELPPAEWEKRYGGATQAGET